jgi:small GTP-binding protein
LAKKQQAIVADRAGTTRDINRAVVRYEGRELEIMDTAGIRRSGKIERGIEHFSVLRSLQAIEQADVCFLLMDVNELNTALDQKIAGMIKEAGKGLVLVVSKWDAAEGRDAFTRDALAPQIAHEFDFVPWAPLIFTSSVTGQNVTKLFDLALSIDATRATRISTRELNKWLVRMTDLHPPAGLKNRAPKLNYMVQEDDNPIPAFKVFGAHTKFLHWSYKRYLERGLRVPLRRDPSLELVRSRRGLDYMTNMLRIPGTLPPGFTAYADAPPTQTPEEIAVGQSTKRTPPASNMQPRTTSTVIPLTRQSRRPLRKWRPCLKSTSLNFRMLNDPRSLPTIQKANQRHTAP